MTDLECKQIFALLSEYVDGDLPEGLCDQIGSHIRGCAPCVEFVESLKKSIELCRCVRDADLPGNLSEAARQDLAAAYARFQSSK